MARTKNAARKGMGPKGSKRKQSDIESGDTSSGKRQKLDTSADFVAFEGGDFKIGGQSGNSGKHEQVRNSPKSREPSKPGKQKKPSPPQCMTRAKRSIVRRQKQREGCASAEVDAAPQAFADWIQNKGLRERVLKNMDSLHVPMKQALRNVHDSKKLPYPEKRAAAEILGIATDQGGERSPAEIESDSELNSAAESVASTGEPQVHDRGDKARMLDAIHTQQRAPSHPLPEKPKFLTNAQTVDEARAEVTRLSSRKGSQPANNDGATGAENRRNGNNLQAEGAPIPPVAAGVAPAAHQSETASSPESGEVSSNELNELNGTSYDYGEMARAAASSRPASAGQSDPQISGLRLYQLSEEEQELQKRYFHLKDPNAIRRCLSCGDQDHVSPGCPPSTCNICGAVGKHSPLGCPRLPSCARCRHKGHTMAHCTSRPDTLTCYKCKASGHNEEECTFLWRTFNPAPRHIRKIPYEDMQVACNQCASTRHWAYECPELSRRDKQAMWPSGQAMWSDAHAAKFTVGLEEDEGGRAEQVGRGRSYQTAFLDDMRD